MLKWAVGQQQKRAETSCCRPPFRKSRRRSSGKENTNVDCRHYEGSPRNRDSVYMRLETIPAVLRDVSNYHAGAAHSPSTGSPSAQRPNLKRPRTSSVRSPERQKKPCVDHHPGLCNNATARSDSPPLSLINFESPPTSLYCFDQSLSPVVLDHKEIPLKAEEKEEIFKTPISRRGFANRISIARRLWNSSNLSPLANQFDLLAVKGLPNSSPNVSESGDVALSRENDVLRNCVSMVNVTKRDEDFNGARTSQTNNDRNNAAFDEERQSSSFAPSIDPDGPSCLRRQRALRRRRRPSQLALGGPHFEIRDDGRSARKMARSCLTLPDGIPSPFESPAFLNKLRRPIFVRSLPDVGESPESLRTWDSHNMHFLKTPRLTDGHVLNDVSPSTSSKIESEDDVVSYSSGNFSDRSPLSVNEGQSKSRRCLTFTSPRVRDQRLPSLKPIQGELELSINYTSGMLTINVIRAKNLLLPIGAGSINAYIKVSMVPCATERTYHRTYVRRGSANPRFDTKFTFEVSEEDLERRILVSAWHRDRGNRKSEFLGCMSFAVKHAVKKVISGWFRLLSQSSGRIKNVPTMTNSDTPWYQQSDVMANQSVSSVEELLSVDDSEQAADSGGRKSGAKKDVDKVLDDHIFLRHLELDPIEETGEMAKPGRTPFTITKTLLRQPGSSYGFSIAWTHPPRVERVEPGLPADQSGLRPGDYVVFLGKINVVTLQEEEILQLIKSFGSRIILEIYRKSSVGPTSSKSTAVKLAAIPGSTSLGPRSSTECSAATTTTATAVSFDLTKRRLLLPQVTFNSELAHPPTGEELRRRCVYQLLGKEQQYALCMQFGIARFMLPLAERRDLISSHEHSILFQNSQELLRLTEDILELYVHEENLGKSLGRIYHKKIPSWNSAYKRYCVGLKKADCLLVEKTRNAAFMKIVTEPAIPKRRPDLTTFIHKPLEHFREVLKLLQTTLSSSSKVKDDDYLALSKAIQEMQATYREITIESGLMEPEGEGRPLLSLQDLESRLVFTRCKPFVLSSPGRQWIFGGDLSRVEGRSVRPFWALLFTDLLLFAKVSRDRVIFVTEEPLQLSNVSQALFSIRKKATEFRLLVSNSVPGEESPAVGGCADLQLTRTPKKGPRRRTLALRAPTPELKAVWQNLIQRQIIYINTARGGTPASSPMDSPDPLTAESLESLATKHRQDAKNAKLTTATDLIEHRCRQLGKTGVSKGSAMHLAQWMRGQLGDGSPEVESEPEVWSPDTLRRRAVLHGRNNSQTTSGGGGKRSASRCEEIELSDVEQSTSDSQVEAKDMTVKSISANSEKLMAMCRKCHKTCLLNNKMNASSHPPASNSGGADKCSPTTVDINANQSGGFSDENHWEQVQREQPATQLSPSDPFLPVPHISIQPPTPTMSCGGSGGGGGDFRSSLVGGNNNNNYAWDGKRESDGSPDRLSGDADEGAESEGEVDEPPYRSLSPCGLRRYGTVSSLEKLDDDESDEDTSREQDDLPSDLNHKPETVAQSIRGWTARAGTYVAEKMSFFDRKQEEGRNVSFLDKYLRSQVDSKQSEELIATSTILAGEDECETSGATSGEEVWGTPTSGDSGMTSPNNEFAETSLGTPFDDAREQLMFDRLLSGMSIMGSLVPLCPVTRGFPQRRRLDPLLEDEEDTSDTSSVDNSDATKSYSTDQGNKSDTCAVKVSRSATSTPHRFLSRLKLRRSQSADSKTTKPNKFMEFLRGSKSEEHTSSSANRLTRLFSRESQDDIPTSLPPDFVQRKEHEKTLDRRFWKQLRKRRPSMSGGGDGGGKATLSNT